MFFFQNLTAELFLLESPDDSYFPKSGGSTFLKTVGSHFSEICGNKITAYTRPCYAPNPTGENIDSATFSEMRRKYLWIRELT